jgi:hypothetical protein
VDGEEIKMKKVRVFLAAASLASALIVAVPGPASAKCVGEPVNPCVIICEIGTGNKYTEGLFRFCHVW